MLSAIYWHLIHGIDTFAWGEGELSSRVSSTGPAVGLTEGGLGVPSLLTKGWYRWASPPLVQ